jgi:hypothetical protein
MSRRHRACNDLAPGRIFDQPDAVQYLTKQQQWVLCAVIGLLLVGWIVKAWRAAHPPLQSVAVPAR